MDSSLQVQIFHEKAGRRLTWGATCQFSAQTVPCEAYTREERFMAQIDAFFKLLHEQGASDLHLMAGQQPVLRIQIMKLLHTLKQKHRIAFAVQAVKTDKIFAPLFISTG